MTRPRSLCPDPNDQGLHLHNARVGAMLDAAFAATPWPTPPTPASAAPQGEERRDG